MTPYVALTGLTVVQSQNNTELAPSDVTPASPEDSEAGAIGVGPEHAPQLNHGIEIPDGADVTPAPTIAGDAADDDGQYIDEILYPNPDGFSPIEEMVAPNLYGDESLETRKAQTRVFQATVPVGTNGGTLYDPVMLFPADPDRVELVLRAISENASTWRFASDKQSCYTAAAFSTADPPLVLRNHTGPVWVYSADGSNGFVVNGWAVSK